MRERRKFSRCSLSQKAKVSTKEDRAKDALLVDVSVGGMKFFSDKKAELGSELSGEFKIVPYLGPYYIQGVVVWTKQAKQEDASGWEIGVKFTKVDTLLHK